MLLARHRVRLPAYIVESLRGIVGTDHVLDDPLVQSTWDDYLVDFTGNYGGSAIVVRPASTNEVQRVVRLLSLSDIPFVAQGANTGLVGGGVARKGVRVVQNLSRLDSFELDEETGHAIVGAGLRLTALQDLLRPFGLQFGIQIKANPSVGGMFATNCGGTRVIYFGMMREQIVGVECVMPDGTVLRRGMGGLRKDNTGLDLAQLLCGSEGTLAVVTAIRVKLWPLDQNPATAMLVVPNPATAITVTRALKERFLPLRQLRALEFIDGPSLTLAGMRLGLRPLFSRPFGPDCAYLLVEIVTGDEHAGEMLEEAILALMGQELVLDADFAVDGNRRKLQWDWRENVTEAIRAACLEQGLVNNKLDVSVPLRHQGDFLSWVYSAVVAMCPGAMVYDFGHAGDDTHHLQILTSKGTDRKVIKAIIDMVMAKVKDLGGSPSSEHGVGAIKIKYLDRSWISFMVRIKGAIDPRWILNPGVLVPRRRPSPHDADRRSQFMGPWY